MNSRHTLTDDVHLQIGDYQSVLGHFLALESAGKVKEYCNGSNDGGRWIFQILNSEFVTDLVQAINAVLESSGRNGPVLEVMAGDGRLSEALSEKLSRPVMATDAKDGRYGIAYPKWVERLDALESVSKYDPALIVVSWEPYLSTIGLDLVATGKPLVWIGNPKMCGHPDIMEMKHVTLKTPYALSRHDSFSERIFRSEVFLFNVDSASRQDQ